jgi:hypothetical protein
VSIRASIEMSIGNAVLGAVCFVSLITHYSSSSES